MDFNMENKRCTIVPKGRLFYSPLSSKAHKSFCDEVFRPPRYLYNSIGRVSSSSRAYLSALRLELVESEKPVSWCVEIVCVWLMTACLPRQMVKRTDAEVGRDKETFAQSFRFGAPEMWLKGK